MLLVKDADAGLRDADFCFVFLLPGFKPSAQSEKMSSLSVFLVFFLNKLAITVVVMLIAACPDHHKPRGGKVLEQEGTKSRVPDQNLIQV